MIALIVTCSVICVSFIIYQTYCLWSNDRTHEMRQHVLNSHCRAGTGQSDFWQCLALYDLHSYEDNYHRMLRNPRKTWEFFFPELAEHVKMKVFKEYHKQNQLKYFKTHEGEW